MIDHRSYTLLQDHLVRQGPIVGSTVYTVHSQAT